MKKNFTFLLLIICLNTNAQVVEVFTGHLEKSDSTSQKTKSVELFGKGLIDYGFQGQLQTTAQAVKVNIGEPDAFYLPLYLLVGATSGDFGTNELNKNTVLSLINPTGGVLNLSSNLYLKIFSSKSDITSLKFTTLFGGKLVSGRDVTNASALLKPAGFVDAGLYFQTGAWEEDTGYQDGGVFWLQARYGIIGMSKSDLSSYFGNTASVPHGPKIELGILVKNKVNIKLSYYKAVGTTNIPTLDKNQFRLALDYSVFK
ncbi:hypothetical protein [Pedobacter ginsengisoli]|uniref:hypothetical protein n=1 Tax=Pedobacter ginsengisoli TaxID=363852 RepID=UPI0025516C1C|nr:hypothetical protein [Pedobacter ginsengisoli]